MDIANIYWGQKLGPSNDYERAARESRQKLTEQGISDDEIHAMVAEHEVWLGSIAKAMGQREA
ncbi:hypothetical protein E6Q11_04665 [Candidatus Dojkabacteria bacterium]|uniref:Uncharacterized protein n=1 Tax=Candidatus Dojkabacteria bacterium TaxID=2099670 RepID=A0A5C7J5S1_9BACT|nr:MAG: hypothetical protein E6Q11_04665 [Candidatus Dojkabacteria bacterium]